MADTKFFCLLNPDQTILQTSVLCSAHYTEDNTHAALAAADALFTVSWFECTGHAVTCHICHPPINQHCVGIRDAMTDRVVEMVDYYGLEDERVPDRVISKLDECARARTPEVARELAQVAYRKMESHCLHQWALGKATGADNPVTLIKRAKKHEGYAEKYVAERDKLQSTKDNTDEEMIASRSKLIEKHLGEAKRLRERADTLKKSGTDNRPSKED